MSDSPRRDNTDRSLARSAWASVPRKSRLVGYGMIGRSHGLPPKILVINLTDKTILTAALELPFADPPLCQPVSPAGLDFFVFDPALRKFPFVLMEVANLDQRRPDLQ
jgi:hypothetical protein